MRKTEVENVRSQESVTTFLEAVDRHLDDALDASPDDENVAHHIREARQLTLGIESVIEDDP